MSFRLIFISISYLFYESNMALKYLKHVLYRYRYKFYKLILRNMRMISMIVSNTLGKYSVLYPKN
jgi:hypothetical protein